MEYTPDYLLEKFGPAIGDLITGPGDARSRVRDAYGHFGHLQIERAPSAIRDDLEWILCRLHKHEPRFTEDTRVDASIRRMQNRTASKIASRIYRIYQAMVRINEAKRE